MFCCRSPFDCGLVIRMVGGETVKVFAIDPGNIKSAWVVLDGREILHARDEPNECMFAHLREFAECPVVIEKVISYGKPVGDEVFETVYWSGRFAEFAGVHRVHRLDRKAIKQAVMGTQQGTDKDVRRALISRFTSDRNLATMERSAIGTRGAPGVLYGIVGDMWAALAVAEAYSLQSRLNR